MSGNNRNTLPQNLIDFIINIKNTFTKSNKLEDAQKIAISILSPKLEYLKTHSIEYSKIITSSLYANFEEKINLCENTDDIVKLIDSNALLSRIFDMNFMNFDKEDDEENNQLGNAMLGDDNGRLEKQFGRGFLRNNDDDEVQINVINTASRRKWGHGNGDGGGVSRGVEGFHDPFANSIESAKQDRNKRELNRTNNIAMGSKISKWLEQNKSEQNPKNMVNKVNEPDLERANDAMVSKMLIVREQEASDRVNNDNQAKRNKQQEKTNKVIENKKKYNVAPSISSASLNNQLQKEQEDSPNQLNGDSLRQQANQNNILKLPTKNPSTATVSFSQANKASSNDVEVLSEGSHISSVPKNPDTTSPRNVDIVSGNDVKLSLSDSPNQLQEGSPVIENEADKRGGSIARKSKRKSRRNSGTRKSGKKFKTGKK